jgi:hypothetical protein
MGYEILRGDRFGDNLENKLDVIGEALGDPFNFEGEDTVRCAIFTTHKIEEHTVFDSEIYITSLCIGVVEHDPISTLIPARIPLMLASMA